MRTRVLLVVVTLAASIGLVPAGAQNAPDVRRVFGSGRIQTAIALSQEVFPGGAQVAVLANDGRFPDALAAAPLAAAAGGPVLLNPVDRLHADVAAELDRLGADTVYLMGGVAAQGASVATALQSRGIDVRRVDGVNRFDTAANAAQTAVDIWRAAGDGNAGDHVLVALGDHPTDENKAWPDALAAGPLAAYAHRPILLTRQGDVPSETNDAIDAMGVQRVTVIGGEGAIPTSTANDLGNGVDRDRIGGGTRFETSTLLADEATQFGADDAIVFAATGANFPDGLAAGPAAFFAGGVLVLVDRDDLGNSAATRDWLVARRGTVDEVVVAGGAAAVTDAVLSQIRGALSSVDDLTLGLVEVAGGLSAPVAALSPPGDPRLFIVEQPGTIRIVQNGQLLPDPFLDIQDRVEYGGEQGLLSLAFHPDYASNGRFFVFFTEQGSADHRLAEFQVSGNPNLVDAGSETEILDFPDPAENHNGGTVMFAPDGRLMLTVGDGGGGGDTFQNGQNTNTLMGKILRLDVDSADPYAIPPDNPYAGGGGAPEVWAIGLRNPWRASIDPVEGILYIGDVGQSAWEEIDAVPVTTPAVNYGWNEYEGSHCYQPPVACDPTGYTMPVLDYASGVVTGGHVYRGSDLPELTGHYFFSDSSSGLVRSFRLVNGNVTEDREWPEIAGGPIVSFGVDAQGELYLVNIGGSVSRIVRG